MAIDLQTGFDALKGEFINNTFLGFEWMLGAIFVFVTIVAITRNPQSWGKLGLPMVVIYDAMGFTMGTLVYSVAGLIFSISIMNTREIGNLVTGANQVLSQVEISKGRVKSSDEIRYEKLMKDNYAYQENRKIAKEMKERTRLNDDIMKKIVDRTKGNKYNNRKELQVIYADKEKQIKNQLAKKEKRTKYIKQKSDQVKTAMVGLYSDRYLENKPKKKGGKK